MSDSPGRVQRWLEHAASWSNIATPPLAEFEHGELDGMGTLVTPWYYPTRGRIVLTNRRLFYMSKRSWPMPAHAKIWPRFEIALGDIERVEMRSWGHRLWGGYLPYPAFAVALRAGRTSSFKLKGAEAWCAQIEQLRPKVRNDAP